MRASERNLPYNSSYSYGFFHHNNRRTHKLPCKFGLRELWSVKGRNGYTLFIDNLPNNMSNLWLRQLFQNDGCVIGSFVPNKMRNGKTTKVEFVRFEKEDQEVRDTMRCQGLVKKSNKLDVKWAKFERNHH